MSVDCTDSQSHGPTYRRTDIVKIHTSTHVHTCVHIYTYDNMYIYAERQCFGVCLAPGQLSSWLGNMPETRDEYNNSPTSQMQLGIQKECRALHYPQCLVCPSTCAPVCVSDDLMSHRQVHTQAHRRNHRQMFRLIGGLTKHSQADAHDVKRKQHIGWYLFVSEEMKGRPFFGFCMRLLCLTGKGS